MFAGTALLLLIAEHWPQPEVSVPSKLGLKDISSVL